MRARNMLLTIGRPICFSSTKRWPELLMGLIIGLTGSDAAGQTCPGPNTQAIHLLPYHFTYESWVLPPARGSAFTYGVCVKNLGARTSISWERAQLSPPAPLGLNQVASATFSFAAGDHRWVKSKLRYGFPQVDQALDVNLLVVDERPPGPPVPSNSLDVQSKVQSWQRQILSVPWNASTYDAYTQTSNFSVPIEDRGGSTAELTGAFSSYLPLKGDYRYQLEYSFVHREGEFVADSEMFFDIAFSPISMAMKRSKVISGDVSTVTKDGRVALITAGGALQFGFVHLEAPTGMQIGQLEIKRSGQTVASVPISFYAPGFNPQQFR